MSADKYVAIAESKYNDDQYVVLTTAKRNVWHVVGRHVKPKLFASADAALKGGRRMTFSLRVEAITEAAFAKLAGYARDAADHEDAEMAASHDYFLSCGDK